MLPHGLGQRHQSWRAFLLLLKLNTRSKGTIPERERSRPELQLADKKEERRAREQQRLV